MKPTMWLLLSGMLVGGAALPANAAPLGSHGLKMASDNSGLTRVGYRYHRHRGHWHSRPSYRYYGEPYYYGYYQPYYRPYYYRPYYYGGPSISFRFGGHRGWRGHW